MLYQLIHGVAKPLVRVVWRPEILGKSNVPKQGPVIVASNHLSFIDSVVIPLTCPRQVHFIAKDQYFIQPGIKGAIQRGFFEGVGMLPVNRDSPRAAQESLDLGLGLLQQGECFGIYPEGTRSKDGRLWRGRSGIGWLVLQSGAPVVPVGLVGTEKVQSLEQRYPRLAHVKVQFGEPLYLKEKYEHLPNAKARQGITDEVMLAIRDLTGQEYTGVYNERTPRPAA